MSDPLAQLRAIRYTLHSCHHPHQERVLLAEGWIEKCRSCLALRKRLADRGQPSPFWPAEHRRQINGEVWTLDGVRLGRL